MQHFLLSSAARTLSLKAVFRMGEDKAYQTFCEMAWREDNRRVDNGAQTARVGVSAMASRVSRQWAGYWQRAD